MKKIILLTTLIISFSILLMPAFVFAQDTSPVGVLKSGLEKSSAEAGVVSSDDIPTRIGTIIGSLFALIGTIFFVFTLIGGFIWMTAGGKEEKVLQAKKFIIGGVEGLIVIFMSYALVFLLLNAFSQGAKQAAGV